MQIAEYLKNNNANFDTPQHSDWIKTKKSEITESEYQYNEIELIEDLMEYFFGFNWGYRIIDTQIVSDKIGFSVTVTVELKFENDKEIFSNYGIASEYAANTKQLTLVTPKAASMAFKNAAKKIGRLFGKDLNRGIENNELPVIQVEKETKKTTQEKIAAQIKSCKTKEELESFKLLAKSNSELEKLYNNKYSEL